MDNVAPPLTNPYQPRLQRVLAHMRRHFDKGLDLDDLADVAALSRFHFHRVFTAMLGQTPAEALRDIRMIRAAEMLISSDLPLAAIGARVGYPAIGSFTRAFRQTYHMTPNALRRTGQLPPAPLPKPTGSLPMYDMTIKTLPNMRVAALPHTGPYNLIGAAFGQLSGIFDAAGLWGAVIGPAIAFYYDSPDEKPAAQLQSHAGMIVSPSCTLPPSLTELSVQSGRYGVLRYTGPYTGLPAAWAWAYAHWLAQSGAELADAAPFELSLNSPMDTQPEALITEICIPLR